MHFNLRRAVAVVVAPLLGSALAIGLAALPAAAATWQDTALSAFPVTADTFHGVLAATPATTHTLADGTKVIDLHGTGVTWSLHGPRPAGVHLFGATISYTGVAISPHEIVVNATDIHGNAVALELPVLFGHDSIQLSGAPITTVSLSALARTNIGGTVRFSAVSSEGNHIHFAQSHLPAGLASGDPVLTFAGGTAAPGTYGGVRVTATDSDGAVLNGVFTLVVHAIPVPEPGNYGDMVNPFGNGFDVFQQNQHAGALIVGWTATKADPATHFIRLHGTVPGAWKFEYAPHGIATGLAVADPGGGWASDPLPDGLILTPSNNGPWQQFFQLPNGTLKNVATGLIVNPNGTGVQLRGGTAPTPWGGSVYTWTDFAHLPG